ncbi:hypothetical protein GUJ93_ZPchr0001g32659 [Zizania palustris]|uniref:Uncharacterized protein n=1 Tax=Zizania palustris TaxID=103762 RepID=A0A8J5RM54_ZIZPA|nr:hypothetical protein GUJ93_ZPchr0001g32659 [Zizania palustris]
MGVSVVGREGRLARVALTSIAHVADSASVVAAEATANNTFSTVPPPSPIQRTSRLLLVNKNELDPREEERE